MSPETTVFKSPTSDDTQPSCSNTVAYLFEPLCYQRTPPRTIAWRSPHGLQLPLHGNSHRGATLLS